MDKKVKELLEKSITNEFENLESLVTDDDRKQAINNIVNLYKLYIDETKIENEYLIKVGEQEMKAEQFNKEIEKQLTERQLRIIMEAAGITLPLLFYAVWMKKGFKFEETGVFTSTTFKGLFNKFKPTK